eukprot:6634214-Alexandrium_andersonii.AAC.1
MLSRRARSQLRESRASCQGTRIKRAATVSFALASPDVDPINASRYGSRGPPPPLGRRTLARAGLRAEAPCV